jgi:hypothetical protein
MVIVLEIDISINEEFNVLTNSNPNYQIHLKNRDFSTNSNPNIQFHFHKIHLKKQLDFSNDLILWELRANEKMQKWRAQSSPPRSALENILVCKRELFLLRTENLEKFLSFLPFLRKFLRLFFGKIHSEEKFTKMAKDRRVRRDPIFQCLGFSFL